MPLPLIGITTYNVIHPKTNLPWIGLNRSYSQTLLISGAIPLLIPVNLPVESLDTLLSRLDGIILSGGGDVETSRFNGVEHEKAQKPDLERDKIEIELFEQVMKKGIPFLGICRGFQVINVALGGTLYTHILDQLENSLDHSNFPEHPRDHLAHQVNIKPDSRLAKIVGETSLEVNSMHHQGIKDLAQGLEPAAWAQDGLVEAVEVEGHPFGLAVQWHPECLPDAEHSQALFSAFVKAASEKKL